MKVVDLVDLPMKKESGLLADAGRAAWRYARRPLLGTERAAVGAEKQLGQMSAKAEQNVANQVTRSGMSRDTHNEILRKFHKGEGYNPTAVLGIGGAAYGGYEGYNDALRTGNMGSILKGIAVGGVAGAAGGKVLGKALPHVLKGGKSHKDLYEAYQKAAPNSITSKIKPKEDLMTTFTRYNQGARVQRAEAQRLKDLEASFSGFGKDQKTLFNLQRGIEHLKGGNLGPLPKGSPYGSLEELLAQRADILATHGKGLLGQKANYYARRAADSILERGQFNTLGERLRFGRLGGAYIGGKGLEVIGARARQGGLLGKGGLIRGSLAWDPRIRMNVDMARYAAGQGQYGQALRYGANAAVGTGVQAGKFGFMGALPAVGVYDAITSDDKSKSMLSRIGGAAGRGFGMTTMMPLGVATWGLSMIPGMEAYSVSEQLGRGLESLGSSSKSVPTNNYTQPGSSYSARAVASSTPTPRNIQPGSSYSAGTNSQSTYVGKDGGIYQKPIPRRRLPSPQVPNYRV